VYNSTMTKEYFEDIKLNEKYRSREYHLSEKEMIEFAKVWEPRPYHIDPEFAKTTKFGSLIAIGNHLMAIGVRLTYELSCEKEIPTAYIVGLGWDEVRFTTPARPGDRLVLEREPISKRESRSNTGAGIVCYANRLLNQQGEIVLTYKVTALVEKRPEL